MTFFDTGNPPGVHKDCWCGSEAEIKAWPGNQADVLQSQNLGSMQQRYILKYCLRGEKGKIRSVSWRIKVDMTPSVSHCAVQ